MAQSYLSARAAVSLIYSECPPGFPAEDPGVETRDAKGGGTKEDAKEEKDNGQSLKKTQGAGEGAANEGGELKSSSGAPGGGHLSRTRK